MFLSSVGYIKTRNLTSGRLLQYFHFDIPKIGYHNLPKNEKDNGGDNYLDFSENRLKVHTFSSIYSVVISKSSRDSQGTNISLKLTMAFSLRDNYSQKNFRSNIIFKKMSQKNYFTRNKNWNSDSEERNSII